MCARARVYCNPEKDICEKDICCEVWIAYIKSDELILSRNIEKTGNNYLIVGLAQIFQKKRYEQTISSGVCNGHFD